MDLSALPAGTVLAAHDLTPSMTIGLDKELLGSTLRFSLSVFTTREEIDYTLHALHELVPMLRRFTRR